MLMLLSICTLLQTASAEDSSQSSKAPADKKQEQKKGTEQGAQKTAKQAPKKPANQAKQPAKTKNPAPKTTEKGQVSTKPAAQPSQPKALAKTRKIQSAADHAVHELSLQAGSVARRGMYSDSILADSNGISGLRIGYGVKPWLSLIASWNVGITADLNSIDSDDDYMIEEVEYPAGNTGSSLSGYLGSQFVHHQLSFGPKFDLSITPNWHPYIASQVVMIHGKLQFSDNIEDDSSLVNITTSDVGFGGNLTAGVEWRSAKDKRKCKSTRDC